MSDYEAEPFLGSSATIKRKNSHKYATVFTLVTLTLLPLIAGGLTISWLFQKGPSEKDISNSYEVPLPVVPFTKFHDQEYGVEPLDIKNQKFLWVNNHLDIQGFGNALQEHVMNALLAYQSGRQLVIGNFSSARDFAPEWVYHEFYHDKAWPNRIPWSAVLSGNMFLNPNDHPSNPLYRPVHLRKYLAECPQPIQMDPMVVNSMHGDSQGYLRLEDWTDYLKNNHTNDRCLQFIPFSQRPFQFDAFASHTLTKVMPLFRKSGLLDNFGFGEMVTSIFKNNIDLFMNTKWTIPWWKFGDVGKLSGGLEHLMVAHIRLGDWERHCNTVTDHWGFQSFNTFDEFEDKPPTIIYHNKTQQAINFKRCFPSIPDMVHKIGSVKTNATTHLYLMTNGSPDWVHNFTIALQKEQKWENVTSTNDLKLTREQSWTSQAHDIYLGRRAGVFIGQGWSSMTSGVSLLRVFDGHANTTRFW